MFKILKNTKLHVCLLATAAMTLSACDAEDLGAIAIGAGVIALCTSDSVDCSTDYVYRDGRRRHRNHDRDTRRDRRDRDNQRDHRRDDRRGNNGRLHLNSVNSVSAAPTSMPSILELGTMELSPVDWSATFGISLENSAKVIDAFDQVKLGNPGFLAVLGLNEKDIKRIGKLKMLKSSGIERMASMLGEPEDKIEAMMKTLHEITVEELEAEAN